MDSFIKKSKIKFNNIFSYEKLNYISTKKPINLICLIHKKAFLTSVRNHLNTNCGGCIDCDFNYRFSQFENKSKEKYGNNFIINKNTFTTGNTKTEIKCIKHDNTFLTSLQKHLSQNDGGCNKCNKNYTNNILNETIKKSKIKFNDNYDFTNFKYLLATIKGELKCKKHNNIINISPSEHLLSIYGGCKLCTSENRSVEKTKINVAKQKKIIKSIVKLEKDEEFKILTLPNYENSYKISNYGKVFSLKNNIYMKLLKNRNGYMQIRIYNNESKSKTFRVHQLVAYMFVDNKDDKKYVDHIDRNKINNYFKNLKWVTHQENMCNTNKNRIIEKNNKIIEENKNNFIKIGIINSLNYSNYLINEDGDIKNTKGKLLKTSINDGYSNIVLIGINNENKKESHKLKIHRLVAYTYLKKTEKFNNDYVVNHIDENRLNNNFKNLEWCTSSENTQKYFQLHNIKKPIIKKNIKLIGKIDIKTNNIIKKYNTFIEASNDISSKNNAGSIACCCKGLRKTACGYKWEFIDE
jgi:hypothetical protein